jgi:hypothetical protein
VVFVIFVAREKPWFVTAQIASRRERGFCDRGVSIWADDENPA